MPDAYQYHNTGLDDPAVHADSVSPHDTNDLAIFSRAIYIGGAGNLALITVGGDTVTFTNMSAGMIYPIRASRILATGTTATGIISLW